MKKIIFLLLFLANNIAAQTDVSIGNTSEVSTVYPSFSQYLKNKILFSPFSNDTSFYAVSNVGGTWRTVPVRFSSLRSSTSPWSINSGFTNYQNGVVTIGGDFAPSSPAGKLSIGSSSTLGYNWIQSYAGLPFYINPIGNNLILTNDQFTNQIFAGKTTSSSPAKMQLKNNQFTQFSLENTIYTNGRLFGGVVAAGYGSYFSQNANYVGGGTYEPSDNHAEIIHFDDVGNTVFYNNNGLTAGTSYTPQERFKIGVNGNIIINSFTGLGTNLLQFNNLGVLVNSGINPTDVLLSSSTAGGDLTGPFNNLQIAANAVSSAEIAADAVGSSELAASSVGTSEIINGAVGNLDLASQSATNGQILDYKGPGVGWTPSDQTENISLLFDTSPLPNVTGITIPGLRVPANLSGWKLTECNIGVLEAASSGTDYVIRGRINSTVTPNAVFTAGTTHLQPIPGGGGITVATGDLLKLEVVTAGTAIPTGLVCTWTFTKQ